MTREPSRGAPPGHAPEIDNGPPVSRRKLHLRLRVGITLTFAGDLGTVVAAISIVVNTPLPVLLVLTLAATSLLLAHKMGDRRRPRWLSAAWIPAVVVTVIVVVWLVAGLVAVL